MEEGGVEERGVKETAVCAVARVRREHFRRNLFGDLEGELERLGGRGEQAPPIDIGGELVEGEIAADHRKGLGVLAETLVLKESLGKGPAPEVQLAGVDLAQPAFILPGAGPDEDVLLGQTDQGSSQPLPVERLALIEKRRGGNQS